MLLRIRRPDATHARPAGLIVYDGIDADRDGPRHAWRPTSGRGPSALVSRTPGAQNGDAAHLLRRATDDVWRRESFRWHPLAGRTRLYPQWQTLVQPTRARRDPLFTATSYGEFFEHWWGNCLTRDNGRTSRPGSCGIGRGRQAGNWGSRRGCSHHPYGKSPTTTASRITIRAERGHVWPRRLVAAAR